MVIENICAFDENSLSMERVNRLLISQCPYKRYTVPLGLHVNPFMPEDLRIYVPIPMMGTI